MKKAAAITAFVVVCVVPAHADALTPAERHQILSTMAYLLDTMYVLPAKGAELAKELIASEAHGEFKDATTTDLLAGAVNTFLKQANDRHLAVRLRPENQNDPLLTVEAWKERFATERGTPERTPDPAMLRRANYGFRKAQVLEGNVGYLDIGGFMSGDPSHVTANAAMTFLANTDAMIIDVRKCPGGSAEAVSYLASYFFGPEPRVLMNRYNRPLDRRIDSTTVPVAGARRPDVPLYILTSNTTASACESFTFTLQQYGRAKVIGERTAGAGYNNAIVPLGKGLNFSISVGTATHPVTKKQFEGVGVQPDTASDAASALEVAEAELRNGGKQASPNPTASSTSSLESYAGTYGNKEISVRDGALYYQRIGGRGGALRQIDMDKFDLNGDATITFVRSTTGATVEMLIAWKDGHIERLRKN